MTVLNILRYTVYAYKDACFFERKGRREDGEEQSRELEEKRERKRVLLNYTDDCYDTNEESSRHCRYKVLHFFSGNSHDNMRNKNRTV